MSAAGASRPSRYAFFDLNGTLFDASPLAELLGGGQQVDAALNEAVMMAMVETITDCYRDFTELLDAAVRHRLVLAGRAPTDFDISTYTARMRPFPDAAEAIERLRAGGLELGVLTNSSTSSARKLIEAAGLDLEPVIGTDQVGAFKPDVRVYERILEAVGCGAQDAILITSHWWDAVGAKRAGMRAGWISREEALWPGIDPRPDHTGADLSSLAAAIAAPPTAR